MVHLDIEEIKNGIIKCFNNSKSLLDDADYLFDGNRIARAFSLYILCIEETQKTYLLFRILLEKETSNFFSKEEEKYYNSFFTSHTLKIKSSSMHSSSYANFAEKHNLKQVKSSIEIRNDFFNPKQRDILKQQGFYTDLVHKKFKEPLEMIKIQKCINIQAEAKLNLSQLTGLKNMYFTCPEVFIDKFKEDDI